MEDRGWIGLGFEIGLCGGWIRVGYSGFYRVKEEIEVREGRVRFRSYIFRYFM